MSFTDPTDAAVAAAVHAGRAYSGDSDYELARVMLRAAMPHLGLGQTSPTQTAGSFDRAWSPVAPGAHRFRPVGFGFSSARQSYTAADEAALRAELSQ